jgi:hypothetical protein
VRTELAEEYTQKSKPRRDKNSSPPPDQPSLWPAQLPNHPESPVLAGESGESGRSARAESEAGMETSTGREKKAIQDVLFGEGLHAVKLSLEVTKLEDLQERVEANLRQNSSETRRRYAQSVVRWFFPDGFEGLARRVWAAYRDERVESDILRYLYLSSEPIMGACVADALFPLQEGIVIPADYFDRFLSNYLHAAPAPKTRKRVKMNLVKLGFLKPAPGGGHRLDPITPTKTGFIVLLHHVFAPVQPRTIELRHLFANPFWKYLGLKSEDTVRGVIREANASGFLGKYVVADELEQITSCLSLAEILKRGVRL